MTGKVAVVSREAMEELEKAIEVDEAAGNLAMADVLRKVRDIQNAAEIGKISKDDQR